jgi:hypothetical protein
VSESGPRAIRHVSFPARCATNARDELAGLKGQKPEIVERRAELTAILVKLSEAKADRSPSARPDSQAAGVAFVLGAMGYRVDVADVGQWIAVGTVVFLELAAALSLTVAAVLYPTTRHGRAGAPHRPAAPAPGIPPVAPGGSGRSFTGATPARV